MRVKLEDIAEFDVEVVNKVPSTLEEAYEMTQMQTSLTDTGLPEGLKEITDFNKVSFGHFIILEKLLSLKISGENKIKLMIPYIVRPAEEPKLDNEDEAKEEKHKEVLMDINLGAAYGIFNRFMEVRHKYLFKDYNGVIYQTLDEDDDDEEEVEEETSVDSGQSAREFHNEKFFWYNLVGTVCNDDIFRRQDAIELMMYEVMPFLAEKRSIAIVENLEAKSRR